MNHVYSDEVDVATELPLQVIDEPYQEHLDEYINTHVAIPAKDGEPPVLAKVKQRKRDKEDVPIGTYNSNPILNTSLYELEFVDGRIGKYTANTICEALWNQVDDDGDMTSILDDIAAHRVDSTAIPISHGTYLNNGITKKVKTTKG